MIEIIPAIIPQNLNIIREKFDKVFGLVKKVQVDILDGSYTSVKTWPFRDSQYEEMRKIAAGEEKFPHLGDFILEIDMMVIHPTNYLSDFISLGAKSFVIHIDRNDYTKECFQIIKEAGCRIGLGVKPSEDISLFGYFLPEVDFVQFMGNDKIGHSGVDLDESVLEKIKDFHQKYPKIAVQIDIGVNEETIPKLKSAGVSRFVSGSSIFTAPNIKERITKLQNF